MEILVISGLSGAGKSCAASCLEDIGYYTVDNMPAAIIPKFAEFSAESDGRYDRVALVNDIRGGVDSFQELLEVIDRLREGGTLCFAGDEPLQEHNRKYAADADWLLHEAFCCYADREKYQPYEKSHSTAKDACELAQSLGVRQLVLWHTEDNDLPHRKERYGAERGGYSGAMMIPDDGEILDLNPAHSPV